MTLLGREAALVCAESVRCLFHGEGGPAEDKCPGYCSVGECRNLVACEDACDGDGACHAHAAQWHAEQANLPGFVTLPDTTSPALTFSPAYTAALAQEVVQALRAEVNALVSVRAETLMSFAEDVRRTAGVDMATPVGQVLAELARLRRATAAAERAAAIVFGQFGRTDDDRIDSLADALREFRPPGLPVGAA